MPLNFIAKFFICALILFSASCSDSGFKRTSRGVIEYKIIPGNSKGNPIKYGDAVRYRRVRYYDDSILVSPYDHIPQIAYIDSNKIIPEYVEILNKAREGDSIITRILVDNLPKYQPDIPSYAQKGKYVGFYLKILSVMTDTVAAEVLENDAVKQKAKIDSTIQEKQRIKDDKKLKDFLFSKGITAVKTLKGTYTEIQSYGNGNSINKGDNVTLNYTASTLDGKIFDSNSDSTANNSKLFTFTIGVGTVIEGLDDGIRLLKKGGKGKLFIPSGLAFGSKGAGIVKPNECVIYQIEVLDINPKKFN